MIGHFVVDVSLLEFLALQALELLHHLLCLRLKRGAGPTLCRSHVEFRREAHNRFMHGRVVIDRLRHEAF